MSEVEYALIVSLGLNVLFAVLIFRFADRQTDVLDRSHERTTEYTADLLNRLMARDWSEYRTHTGPYEVSEPENEEIELVPVLGPDRGGFGSRLGLSGYRAPDEEINPDEEMP